MSNLRTPAGYSVSLTSSRFYGPGTYAFGAYIGETAQGSSQRRSVSGLVHKSHVGPGWIARVTTVTSSRSYPGLVRGEVERISAVEDHLEARPVSKGESTHWIEYPARTRLLAIEAAFDASSALVTASRDRQHAAALLSR